MRRIVGMLHARMGDLWWYSLMIFIACRFGDAMQTFIGLWLVPKYVGVRELGAVLPLQQLSTLFAVPLAIIATVFSKYVNAYATRGEYGKVKCFIRDVLLASCALFVVSIAAAEVVIPHFYVRLNVVSGMLTALILASGFVGSLNSLFGSALQGLKKFKTISVQNFISTPIRLATLLVAMPFRALSGYVLGQTTPAAACSLLAAFTLRGELANRRCDTSWRRDLPEIWRYLWPYAIITALGAVTNAVVSTVYRQRLSELESAAYYMLTRFSEIAGYVGCSILVVLFPLVSEAHESGRDTRGILRKSVVGICLASAVIAAAFQFLAPTIFSLTDDWRRYSSFVHLLPALTLTVGLTTAITTFQTHELACRRFGIPAVTALFGIVWAAFLVSFTGCEFFRGILPDAVVDAMGALKVARLGFLTHLNLAFTALQLAVVMLVFSRNGRR